MKTIIPTDTHRKAMSSRRDSFEQFIRNGVHVPIAHGIVSAKRILSSAKTAVVMITSYRLVI